MDAGRRGDEEQSLKPVWKISDNRGMDSLLMKLKAASAARRLKALAHLNYDLFSHQTMAPPAPATLYTAIKEHAAIRPAQVVSREVVFVTGLPNEADLYRLFDEFNWLYFNGRLPSVRIKYSSRMTSAGSYTPSQKLIRIGRKYHEVFPDELSDTLKHEMIHIIHIQHDREFKKEASRIGASLRARSHPSLHKPPRYIYVCPVCDREYPRQKRLRMASCGVCSKKGYDERYKLRLKR